MALFDALPLPPAPRHPGAPKKEKKAKAYDLSSTGAGPQSMQPCTPYAHT